MKTLWILYFTTMVGSWSYALEFDFSKRVQAIIKARSVVKLEAELETLEQGERANRLCRAELKGAKVPVHCLELYKFTPADSELAYQKSMVSRLCQKAVAKIDSISEIHTLLPRLSADSRCFEAASKRKLILEYMHPELITEGDGSHRL